MTDDAEQTTDQEAIDNFMRRVDETAHAIDPRTATLEWSYEDVCDPYGLDPREREWSNYGREYFLADGKGPWVLVRDVRRLHPDISDEDWNVLMRRAAARDESPDPFPMFHSYRGFRLINRSKRPG